MEDVYNPCLRLFLLSTDRSLLLVSLAASTSCLGTVAASAGAPPQGVKPLGEGPKLHGANAKLVIGAEKITAQCLSHFSVLTCAPPLRLQL
jgi:hypothetical protein